MRLHANAVTLVLMLTDACNLACAHCFKSNRSHSETPLDAMGAALTGLKRLFGKVHVSLSGGEPTLHSRFGEILALIASHSQRFHLVTNGSNFLPRTLPLLLPYKGELDCVAFSLDGADARSHDMIRGAGSFDRVMDALARCRENGIGTRICCTLNRWNLGQIDPLRRLVKTLGITHGAYLWTAIPTPGLLVRGGLLDSADRAYLVRRREALAQEGLHLIGDLRRMDDRYDVCEALSMRQVTLDSEGNVSLCCNLTRYAGETDRRDVLGSPMKAEMATLLRRQIDASAAYMKAMLRDMNRKKNRDPHAYACTHCARYHGKFPWLSDGLNPSLFPQSESAEAPG